MVLMETTGHRCNDISGRTDLDLKETHACINSKIDFRAQCCQFHAKNIDIFTLNEIEKWR